MFKKLILYYFTGTGNALAASNWIEKVATDREIEVEKIRITPSLTVLRDDFLEDTLVGICYPTHGFNAPPIVINFCLRFPKIENRVFLLNTRAGMKLHKLFTPGLSGLAQIVPSLILRSKGLKIVGCQPLDLPSNWIAVHPGLRKQVVGSIFLRCEEITRNFARYMLNGQKIYKGLISLPVDLLISPISIAYYILGRFALAKSFIADHNCNSCKLCEKECPVQAIVIKRKRPFWTRKCESCMHCLNSCPQRAIQTPHLILTLLWWMVFSTIPVSLTKWFAQPDGIIANHFDLFVWIFLLITGIPVLFFSYRILHFLMRFKLFSFLVSYTSFTRFKFWRRYSAPSKYTKI